MKERLYYPDKYCLPVNRNVNPMTIQEVMAQAWISVDERLPGPFDDAIISILTKNGYDEPITIETIGYYEHEWHSYTGRIHEGERVTHWIPMPPSPLAKSDQARKRENGDEKGN